MADDSTRDAGLADDVAGRCSGTSFNPWLEAQDCSLDNVGLFSADCRLAHQRPLPRLIVALWMRYAAGDRIDTIHLFLPDPMIDIQVWAPIDPLLVLEALKPL